MVINHNLISMNISNQLKNVGNNKSKSMEKLSSGLRINRASDDSAGLAISQKMKAQIRGLEQAGRNIQDGISLIQTAEGGLNEIHNALQRIRELAVQASNGTLTDDDRDKIQQEVKQLKSGVNDIANNTEFNGIKIMNGSISGYSKNITSTTEIQTPGASSKCNANINIPSTLNVVGGVNDQLNFDIDGVPVSITINAGTYNSSSLVNEINSKFSSSSPSINATISYATGNLEVKNNNTGSSHSINNLAGSLIDSLSIDIKNGYISPINFYSATMLDYNYNTTTFPYTCTHNPYVNIQAGINDVLSFKYDGVSYSLTIPPQSYPIDFHDGSISTPPITSQFIKNLNSELNSIGVPIEAYFQFNNGTIGTADYGTSLYFRVKPTTSGVHALGDFGGNAKSSILMSSIMDGIIKILQPHYPKLLLNTLQP